MLEKHQVNEVIINNEVERIKLVFIKNNYNLQQKLWFINAKKILATKNKDLLLLKVCNKLLNDLV